MYSFDPMERAGPFVARPGALLCGATIFGLVAWLGIIGLLTRLPGIEARTYLSAAAMAGLFAVLLLVQRRSWIEVRDDGIRGRTFFRRLRCDWNSVNRVDVHPFLPGLTIFLVATRRGPLVFTSLWRNHRELLQQLRRRAGLD